MPFKGHQGVILAHPIAIILDPHQGTAAVPKFHFDAGRSGIQRIFHQFLDDRSWPLNHLSGGDLISNPVGQDSNSGHGRVSQSRKPGRTEARNYSPGELAGFSRPRAAPGKSIKFTM